MTNALLDHALVHQARWHSDLVGMMRANLDTTGKLTPPRNVDRGLVRLKQLRYEIKRLDGEIDEAVTRHTAAAEWLGRAKKNKDLLRSEYLQLVRWLAEQTNPVPACVSTAGTLCAAHATGAADAAPCGAEAYRP